MKQIFTEAAGLLKATETGRDLEHDAFNLGMGDAADLQSAGLMARSNAAVAILEKISDQKNRDKRFEDLIYEQIRKSLDDIRAEMVWLYKQIKVEEKVIQTNNTDIDFIRSLDDDNIMGADGKPRSDVKALLKKHGYDDVDNMDVADILLVTQTIETDLHGDNIARKERINDYQDRHDVLRQSAKRLQENLPDDAPADIQKQAAEIASSEPYEVNYRAMKEAATEDIATAMSEAEMAKTEAVVTSSFKPF